MLGKGKSILWFCGSMMSNSAHCRIINCPRVEAIGTFLKGTNQFVERHFACDDVSQEDGLRLRANILTSLPYLRSLYPSIATSLLQGFAHELLYQANNRAAENHVREIGSIHEDYNRVAATVTAVSIWINRNKKDKVISAIRNSHHD
jgi:hypothetical protein